MSLDKISEEYFEQSVAAMAKLFQLSMGLDATVPPPSELIDTCGAVVRGIVNVARAEAALDLSQRLEEASGGK